jgi:hypothetical protein
MPNTHMGQTPDNHVTLHGQRTTAGFTEFNRIGPDGKGVEGFPFPFRVPPGQVLVVTDIDWAFVGGSPGEIQIFQIFLRPIDDPGSDGNPVFVSAIILNNNGEGGRTEAMTSGFVVSSNGVIHPEMDNPGAGAIGHLIIRGYLIDES